MSELKVYVCDKCGDITKPINDPVAPKNWVRMEFSWKNLKHLITQHKKFHICEKCFASIFGCDVNDLERLE